MKLHTLKNSTTGQSKKRVGRGEGNGRGKTSCRGQKGQGARSGSKSKPFFEGGQIPLFRRLPHFPGFRSRNHKQFTTVNVSSLEKLFNDGDIVDIETLLKTGLISDIDYGLKILSNGDLTKSLTVKANAFSKTAIEKIEKSGGSCEVL